MQADHEDDNQGSRPCGILQQRVFRPFGNGFDFSRFRCLFVLIFKPLCKELYENTREQNKIKLLTR